MKKYTSDRISTDLMNDIISSWVDVEITLNPAGYADSSERQRIRDAQSKRFEQIVLMPDDEFRALYHAKTGDELSAMNVDGSYNVKTIAT